MLTKMWWLPIALFTSLAACGGASRSVPPPNVAPVEVKFKVVGNEKMAREYDGKRVKTYVQFMLVSPAREAPVGYDDKWTSISVTDAEVEGGKPKCGASGGVQVGGQTMIQAIIPNAMAPQMMDLKPQTVIEIVGIVRVGGILNAIEIESFTPVGGC